MSTGPIRLSETAHTALRPASAARITGGFWAERRRVNATVSIPQGPRKLEEAGNLDNLRAAAGTAGRSFSGDFEFQDSDVHKWLEAAAWQYADTPEPALAAGMEELIGLLAAAQDDDGYLQTYYQLRGKEARWRELAWGHELYCAGHLIQAAVAHHRATGREELLAVALRFAEHIDATFGPSPGKSVDGVCGHPEIETALIELYRETGERRWLRLAAYFLDRRGHGVLAASARAGRSHGQDPGAAYWQDHLPLREAPTVTGHVVRQLYLLAGAADLAAETGEPELRAALERMWTAMVETKTYLTGGLGARHEGEAFGDPYELPPDRAYAETCAAIASVQFSWRMALLTGEARYSDLIERTLFNGFLSGVGLDGEHWLYVNPLQVHEDYALDGAARPEGDQTARRTPWFRCACCPPNAMRLLASLPHYAASGAGGASGERAGLHLHQYATGTYAADGGAVSVQTDYPWSGRIAVTVTEAPAEEEWTLALRVPEWTRATGPVAVDGEPVAAGTDGWLRLRRIWTPGATVVLDLPLAPRVTRPHPRVDAVRGCVALEYGPLLHCLEEQDLPDGVAMADVRIDPGASLAAEHRPGLLGGVTVLTDGALTAVPYHAWANRASGAMRVWIPRHDC